MAFESADLAVLIGQAFLAWTIGFTASLKILTFKKAMEQSL